MNTPVAFIIFNRPDVTRRVFDAIARAQPKRLLVVADGPRNSEEAEKCWETRAIIEQVNWDCEVLSNFSDVNIGCKGRVSSGLDWVFENCEEAIILEDDCLPHESFFPFCEELLERFRNDERVGMICGSNFQQGTRVSTDSYFFTLNVTAWGWASWRRAWQNYDVSMNRWPALRESDWLEDLLVNPVAVKYWRETLESTYLGEQNTWDYQFFFSWWASNALAAIPQTNLVTNIGFGDASTHTRDTLPTMANLPLVGMEFPLKHPTAIEINREADTRAFRNICPWIIENQSYYWQLRHKLVRSLPDPVRTSVRRLRARVQNSDDKD